MAAAATASATELVFDVSLTDWPRIHPDDSNWVSQTWGEAGLDTVMDTIKKAGANEILFRSHAAGPYWPTQVPGGAECKVALGQGLSPDFSQWHSVQSAATAAHINGVTAMGWFDLTEGHAGYPTAWSLDHPEYCIVKRDGVRMDGPIGLVGNGGAVITRETAEMMGYYDLLDGGFMSTNCLRPDGAPVDPFLSFAYPEAVQYRLDLLGEMFDAGVDGVYLVTTSYTVGYEAPVVAAFQQKYGFDPLTIPETDPRWIEHKQGYFTDFVSDVHDLIVAKEQATGRDLKFVLEGQSPGDGPWPAPEPGWQSIPPWAQMPNCVDVETIAQEQLVDALAYWTFNEIDALNPAVRNNVEIQSRYRYMGESFTQSEYQTRLAEAESRGVSKLIINEPYEPLANDRWMYPGEPGELYKLGHPGWPDDPIGNGILVTVNGQTAFHGFGFENDAPALPRHEPVVASPGFWVNTSVGNGHVEIYDATSDPAPGPHEGAAYCVLVSNPTPGAPWEYGSLDAQFASPTTSGDLVHVEYALRIDGLSGPAARESASYVYSCSLTTEAGSRWYPDAKVFWGLDFQEGTVATYDSISTTGIGSDEMIVFFLQDDYYNVTTGGGAENMYISYDQWHEIEMDYVDDGGSWTLTIDGITSDPMPSSVGLPGWDVLGKPLVSLNMAATSQNGVGVAYIDGKTSEDPLPGDINNDGIVDGADAAILASNWQTGPGANWSMGDFNADGFVNDVDAAILAANWQHTSNTANVPEPRAIGLSLIIVLCGLIAASRVCQRRAMKTTHNIKA